MTDQTTSIAAIGGAVFLGVMTWSFLEYCIHRWLGHDKRLLNNPFGREHTAHHSQGDYFAPASKKAVAALGFFAVFLPLAVWVAGWTLGTVYVSSAVGFYIYYEVLHRMDHVTQGIGPYGRWARAHHFYHHFLQYSFYKRHDTSCQLHALQVHLENRFLALPSNHF